MLRIEGLLRRNIIINHRTIMKQQQQKQPQLSLKSKLDQAQIDVRAHVIKEQEELMLQVTKRTGKVILVTGIVLGGLYFSKYLFKALSGTITACKELKRAIKA